MKGTNLTQLLGYQSLPECVVKYLKNMLAIGDLKPGTEINLSMLSTTLGISRTPIREALIQLVKDGLVDIVSRRKFVIKKLTLENLKHLYFMIGLLESEAAVLSCGQITQEDIAKLEDLYCGMEKALKGNEFLAYLDMNTASHDIIIKYCQNAILLDMLKNIRERLSIILYDFHKIIENTPELEVMLMADHIRMIQAIKAYDKEVLGKIIKNEHWDFDRNYPYLLEYYEICNIKNSESLPTGI
jgi:DNA-binding GntR family transcriptional regulator